MLLQKPGGNRLRVGRISESGRIYLVTTVTQYREPVFGDMASARAAVNVMRFQHDHEHVESLAYVLMPDHLHWLVRLTDKRSLSDIIRSFKSYSGRAVNRIRRHDRPLWQAGFYDRALRAEDDVHAAARYIVANPLRANLVEEIGRYPFWDAIWL